MDKHRPGVGVGVLIIRDGCVLLAKRLTSHGHGMYSIAGGKMDWGESIEATAVREVREETGLNVEAVCFVSLGNHVFDDLHFLTVGVVADAATGTPQRLEPESLGEWEWYPLDALPEPLYPPAAFVIQAYQVGGVVELHDVACIEVAANHA